MTRTNLSVTFPLVKYFDDYHDIPEFMNDLNELFNSDKMIVSMEISVDVEDSESEALYVVLDNDTYYWGVFYIGSAPSTEELVTMITRAQKRM